MTYRRFARHGTEPRRDHELQLAPIALFQGGTVRTVPIVEECSISLERIGP
jgi:hypothetical protein